MGKRWKYSRWGKLARCVLLAVAFCVCMVCSVLAWIGVTEYGTDIFSGNPEYFKSNAYLNDVVNETRGLIDQIGKAYGLSYALTEQEQTEEMEDVYEFSITDVAEKKVYYYNVQDVVNQYWTLSEYTSPDMLEKYKSGEMDISEQYDLTDYASFVDYLYKLYGHNNYLYYSPGCFKRLFTSYGIQNTGQTVSSQMSDNAWFVFDHNMMGNETHLDSESIANWYDLWMDDGENMSVGFAVYDPDSELFFSPRDGYFEVMDSYLYSVDALKDLIREKGYEEGMAAGRDFMRFDSPVLPLLESYNYPLPELTGNIYLKVKDRVESLNALDQRLEKGMLVYGAQSSIFYQGNRVTKGFPDAEIKEREHSYVLTVDLREKNAETLTEQLEDQVFAEITGEAVTDEGAVEQTDSGESPLETDPTLNYHNMVLYVGVDPARADSAANAYDPMSWNYRHYEFFSKAMPFLILAAVLSGLLALWLMAGLARTAGMVRETDFAGVVVPGTERMRRGVLSRLTGLMPPVIKGTGGVQDNAADGTAGSWDNAVDGVSADSAGAGRNQRDSLGKTDAGENREEGYVLRLNRFDRISTELLVLLLGAGVIILGCNLINCFVISLDGLRDTVDQVACSSAAFIAYLMVMGLSLVRRIKAHNLREHMLLRQIWRHIFRNKAGKRKRWEDWKKILCIFAGCEVMSALAAYFIWDWSEPEIGFSVFAVVMLVSSYVLCVLVQDVCALSRAVSEISEGHLDYQVDFKGKHRLLGGLGDGLNHVGNGLKQAVETSLKDERMKTELITNVSHDLKTPLTSIISYIDLLKKEKMPTPEAEHYVEVLDQKAQRLKQLTEDLVEAAKANTGNIDLELMPLNFAELMKQAIGEFEDKFAGRKLQMIASHPEETVMILADGRRMFRILENVLQNAYKYALEGTRIYAKLWKEGETVCFEMKNISRDPLNISPEELMERFTRGDAARSTEGSGLGLSIAKDLTGLQGGTFEILLDGDLFKIVIRFPEYREG